MPHPSLHRDDAGPGRGWRGLRTEAVLVALALVVNGLVRWHTRDDLPAALRHGQQVHDLERSLGVDWERAVQDAALATPGLPHVASHYYVWGYLPVLAATMVWLYLRRPQGYRLLRNALLVSGVLGVAVYALYPCAPPRLMETGFVDTVARHSLDDAARPVGIANELAALPSFHVGWLALGMVVLLLSVRSRALRVLCVVHPILMTWAVVASGNHWVLDVPAGLATAGVGLLAAAAWERLRPARSPAPARSAPVLS